MCEFSHAGTHTLARKYARTGAQFPKSRQSIYLPAAACSSNSAMSRSRFFTRQFCTHTRLLAANTPSLASLTSRAEGAGRGRGRMFHLLTAWAVFRGANLNFSVPIHRGKGICCHSQRKRHLLSIHRGKGICCQLLLTRKLFFRTFLSHENFSFELFYHSKTFLSNFSITRKLFFRTLLYVRI